MYGYENKNIEIQKDHTRNNNLIKYVRIKI